MTQISYARRAIERRSLQIDQVFPPNQYRDSFAVFGGMEDERIEVVIRGLRRSINNQAIIILHDSMAFVNAIVQRYQPIIQVNTARHSYDPLVGIDRSDAIEVRRILHDAVSNRSIVCIRTPSSDIALQRMLESELRGLNNSYSQYLLVIFGISQTAEGPFMNLLVGDHGSSYSTAVSGSTVTRAVSHDHLQDILQGYDEVVILPTTDMQEAQKLTNCFGSYMRSYVQRTTHTHGFGLFRHRDTGLTQHQSMTNNIDPISLRNHTVICGQSFQEPVIVGNLLL